MKLGEPLLTVPNPHLPRGGKHPRRPHLMLPNPSPVGPSITDTAVGCVLVLTAVVLTATGAVPFPKPLGVLADARGCHLAQFQSLSPQELQAFKRAKDTFVSLPLPHLLGARLHLCLSGLPCCTPPKGDLPPSLTRLTSPSPAAGRLLSSCGGGASITFCTLTWAPAVVSITQSYWGGLLPSVPPAGG